MKIWKKTSVQDFYKSLDNHSFTFKMLERKSLTQKVIVKEIKVKHGFQQKEILEGGGEDMKKCLLENHSSFPESMNPQIPDVKPSQDDPLSIEPDGIDLTALPQY